MSMQIFGKKVTELEKESEQFDSVDSKLQVWNEVDDIINNNISPLLEVTSKDDVIALLDDISDSSTKVDKSVIADDMKKLQDNIESTKQKINTVKEAEKETYDIYRLIFIVGAISCAVMFVVSVILFITLKIPNVIGDLTGRNAKRQLKILESRMKPPVEKLIRQVQLIWKEAD